MIARRHEDCSALVLSHFYGEQDDLAEQNLADYCPDIPGRLDGQHQVNGDSALLAIGRLYCQFARHNYDARLALSASRTQALRLDFPPPLNLLPITINGLTVGQSPLLKPTSCQSPLVAHYAHGMRCWPRSSSGILETP